MALQHGAVAAAQADEHLVQTVGDSTAGHAAGVLTNSTPRFSWEGAKLTTAKAIGVAAPGRL